MVGTGMIMPKQDSPIIGILTSFSRGKKLKHDLSNTLTAQFGEFGNVEEPERCNKREKRSHNK